MDFAYWEIAVATGVEIESGHRGVASPSNVLVRPFFIAGVPEGVTDEEIFQKLFINSRNVPNGAKSGFRPEWPPETLNSFTFHSDTIQWSELKD